jgi:hypothetical protein
MSLHTHSTIIIDSLKENFYKPNCMVSICSDDTKVNDVNFFLFHAFLAEIWGLLNFHS